MNNDLEEIKQLIRQTARQNQESLELLESKLVLKSDFVTFKMGVFEHFERQNEYFDEIIREVGKENRNHLEALLEQKNEAIRAITNQYFEIYDKIAKQDQRIAALEI
jgi:hypothetical protein